MNQQIYADGSDREQSPGYAGVVLSNLLDTKLLDQDNGYAWPAAQSNLADHRRDRLRTDCFHLTAIAPR